MRLQSEKDIRWLHYVRDREFEAALVHFPAARGARVLEIGSGTGYLLGKICERYPGSAGLEVEGSAYQFVDRHITLYDGKNIPFPDNAYDVVFSSHVLEHVAEITDFGEEIARVLKPGGVAVHIIPSPTWRVLTSLLHYFAIVKMAMSLFWRPARGSIKAQSSGRTKADLAKFLLFAPRHGEFGNVLTETYYFSQAHWSSVFSRSSLQLLAKGSIGFVYWGRDLFQFALPMSVRTFLASLIGASSNVYVLRKGGVRFNGVVSVIPGQQDRSR